jgi:hypothetical protein
MPSVSFSPELIRLVGAAAISPDFCHLLLDDPELAMEGRSHGAPFLITRSEREIICSISATSLADFAAQLVASSVNRDRRPSGTSGKRRE